MRDVCDTVMCVLAENKAVGVMKPGHTFTIEPMISEGESHTLTPHTLTLYTSTFLHVLAGTWRDVTWPDNWTAATVVSVTECSTC